MRFRELFMNPIPESPKSFAGRPDLLLYPTFLASANRTGITPLLRTRAACMRVRRLVAPLARALPTLGSSVFSSARTP
jgi:hypothetical protein